MKDRHFIQINLIILMLIVIFVLRIDDMFPANEVPLDISYLENLKQASLNQSGSGDGYGLGIGNVSAIVIVEFTDFSCPICVESYGVVKKILEEYPYVTFTHKHFPVHSDSTMAAVASECARDQGKFSEYSDSLYSGEREYVSIARNLNLDVDLFSQCIKDGNKTGIVESDTFDGMKLGVKGTPTFFINGKKYEGYISYEEMKGLINELRADSK